MKAKPSFLSREGGPKALRGEGSSRKVCIKKIKRIFINGFCE
jgi:hypothetical protein